MTSVRRESTHLLAVAALAAFAGSSRAQPAAAPANALERGFKDPPDSAKPRVWWHWLNGNVTKEGITADLEWMKRVGIAGCRCSTAVSACRCSWTSASCG
jgi:(4-O-methyl)-D-glucuronate---lignin esterase